MLVAGALPNIGAEDGQANIPHYEYMPIDVDITRVGDWIRDKRAELQEEYVLYRTDYWYLDQISCVLVQRNREWFSAVIPKFVSIWETIEKERVSGYSHRASVKKSKSGIAKQAITADSSTSCGNTSQFIRNIQTSPAGGGICLIKLDEAGNNIVSQNTIIETHNVLLL
jgi:hypothetical protein